MNLFKTILCGLFLCYLPDHLLLSFIAIKMILLLNSPSHASHASHAMKLNVSHDFFFTLRHNAFVIKFIDKFQKQL